jgi:uncharacterized protein (TIGR03435 family)
VQRANLVLVLIAPLLATPDAARSQVAPKLEFEVASVRASAPQSAGQLSPPHGQISGGPGTSDPTRMTFSRVPLANILMIAFDVPANRLQSPGWTANVVTPVTNNISKVYPGDFRYDIIATMPPGTTKVQAHEMLRNLLIDRFKLTYHLEKKDFNGYAATAAKGGVKLKPSEAVKESEARPLAATFPLGPDAFAVLPAGQPAIVATIVDASRKTRWSFQMMPVSSLLEMLKLFLSFDRSSRRRGEFGRLHFGRYGLDRNIRLQIRISGERIAIWSRS